MSLTVKTLNAADRTEYSEFVYSARGSVVQHTLEWQDLLVRNLSDRQYCLVAREKGRIVGVLPALLRESPSGSVLNSLPLSGSHGGVCTSGSGVVFTAVFKKLIEAFLDLSANAGCISSTIITSPFDTFGRKIYEEYFKPDFVWNRFTQLTYLRGELNFGSKVRNHIKKASKSGVVVKEEFSSQVLEDFHAVYAKNMRFLNLAVKPISFFRNIDSYLLKRKMAKFFFGYFNNKMISALLVGKYKNMINGLETVADPDYRSLQANSLVTDYALRQMRKEGYEIWNWGASESKESGVYKFKRAWGARDKDYFYFTRIHNRKKLQELNIDRIKSEYAWYYVCPFSELKK